MSSRRISIQSSNALSMLEALDKKMKNFQDRAERIEEEVQSRSNSIVVHAYVEMAVLIGELEKFQAQELDAVATSELSSGKDEVRAKRKTLNVQVTALVDVLRRIYAKKSMVDAGKKLLTLSLGAVGGSAHHLTVLSDFATDFDPIVKRKHKLLVVRKGESVQLVDGDLRNGLPGPYYNYIIVKSNTGTGKVPKSYVMEKVQG